MYVLIVTWKSLIFNKKYSKFMFLLLHGNPLLKKIFEMYVLIVTWKYLIFNQKCSKFMFLLLHENVFLTNLYFHGTRGSYYEITAPQAKFFGNNTQHFEKIH